MPACGMLRKSSRTKKLGSACLNSSAVIFIRLPSNSRTIQSACTSPTSPRSKRRSTCCSTVSCSPSGSGFSKPSH